MTAEVSFSWELANCISNCYVPEVSLSAKKFNAVMLGADSSALKMLLELTKQPCKPKQGVRGRKPPGYTRGSLEGDHEYSLILKLDRK